MLDQPGPKTQTKVPSSREAGIAVLYIRALHIRALHIRAVCDASGAYVMLT